MSVRLEFLWLATKSILPKPGGLCLEPEAIFPFSASQKKEHRRLRQVLLDREKCHGSERETKNKAKSKMPQRRQKLESWSSMSNIDKTGRMHVESEGGRLSHGGECVCLTGLKGPGQVGQTVLNEVITFFKQEDTAFLMLLENTWLSRKSRVLLSQRSPSWLLGA